MEYEIKFENYIIAELQYGNYCALVTPRTDAPRIEIPEEYNGIPITEIGLRGYSDEPIRTICVSKNVKKLSNYPDHRDYTLPYFVEISPENPWLYTDGKAVFSKDKKILYAFTARNDESYVIPDGVKVIYHKAFYKAHALKKITFPDGLEEILNSAFSDSNVSELELPNTLKEIGSRALSHLNNIESIDLPNNIKEIEENAFVNSRCLSPVYIPDCYNKAEFCIPNYSFAPEYFIKEDSETLTMLDGVIYTKDMKILLAISKKAPSEITVPEGVEIIAVRASELNSNIRKILLPRSVHTICSGAFSCSGLERINLENVKIIGDSAFESCFSLFETGNIGAKKIGMMAFANCKSLRSVWLTNAKELGARAFQHIKDDAEIYLPEGLEIIKSNAFDSKFRFIRIPRSASASENIFADAKIIELYDVKDSAIYGGIPKFRLFPLNSLIRVLSPENDEIKFAIKIFETNEVWKSSGYINSLFGGEQFFDLQSYDAYFKSVCNRDELPSKYEAAYYRIKYPAGLTDEARKMYTAYLESYAADVIRIILDREVVTAEKIVNFPCLDKIGEADLLEIIDLSAARGLTEITAFLMNYKHEHFPNSTHLEELL